MFSTSKFFFTLLGIYAMGSSALAAPATWKPSELRVERIVDRSGTVKIKGDPVKAGATGYLGEKVETVKTKAEVFFPNSAQGVMLAGTSLLLGERCIQLVKDAPGQRPRVLVSGAASVCLGDRKFGNLNSTVIVEQEESGNYLVAVLAGQLEVADAEATVDTDFDIRNRFPTVSTTFGVGGSGYTNAYPTSGGLMIGSLNTFVPLSQHRSSSVLYFYSTTGSNFDGYWGATTEVGYRWFMPSNRSTSSVYVGYSGFDSLSCFSNLINVGAGWEKGRWRLGVSSGFNTGGCDSSFSFGALNVSIPVAKIDRVRSAYVNLTPYILWGDNVPSPSNYYDDSGTSYSPGLRLSVSVPATESISLSAFGTVDVVSGASVGGMFKLRFPSGGGFIRDPNLTAPAQTVIAGQGPGESSPASVEPSIAGSTVIKEAYKASFTPSGQQIGEAEKLTPEEMISFISDYLEGTRPLAESHRVAQVAATNNALTTRVAGILGINYLESASIAASETAQQPFDISYFPTAPYACVASEEGQAYAVDQLIKDGKIDTARRVAAADKVYLGPGDKISNGWPITTSSSNAYRFGNGGTCGKINSIIENDASYDGPNNPVRTMVIK
jgi:hypothetical protein